MAKDRIEKSEELNLGKKPSAIQDFIICPKCGNKIAGDLLNTRCPECGYEFLCGGCGE